MHELGTVFYVIKEVEKLCDENELTTVGSVTLQIGEVSGTGNSVRNGGGWSRPEPTRKKGGRRIARARE